MRSIGAVAERPSRKDWNDPAGVQIPGVFDARVIDSREPVEEESKSGRNLNRCALQSPKLRCDKPT